MRRNSVAARGTSRPTRGRRATAATMSELNSTWPARSVVVLAEAARGQRLRADGDGGERAADQPDRISDEPSAAWPGIDSAAGSRPIEDVVDLVDQRLPDHGEHDTGTASETMRRREGAVDRELHAGGGSVAESSERFNTRMRPIVAPADSAAHDSDRRKHKLTRRDDGSSFAHAMLPTLAVDAARRWSAWRSPLGCPPKYPKCKQRQGLPRGKQNTA